MDEAKTHCFPLFTYLRDYLLILELLIVQYYILIELMSSSQGCMIYYIVVYLQRLKDNDELNYAYCKAFFLNKVALRNSQIPH